LAHQNQRGQGPAFRSPQPQLGQSRARQAPALMSRNNPAARARAPVSTRTWAPARGPAFSSRPSTNYHHSNPSYHYSAPSPRFSGGGGGMHHTGGGFHSGGGHSSGGGGHSSGGGHGHR